ncbi:MAG: hypothetical protein OEM98_09970 [Gammaproteobacteria bacterium]|nr:hypothetical protein [Gammaproteobacteria bacterium]
MKVYLRARIAAAAVFGVLLVAPATRAADTWPLMKWDQTDVFIQLGEYQADPMVYPGELTFQKCNLYRFVVINPSKTSHIVAAPEFGAKVLTTGLMKFPPSADLSKASLAEGIVVRPGEMMEWYLMPVKEGA